MKKRKGTETCTPGFPMTTAAAPSFSGGEMNSPRLMEEGLSGFSEAGASRSRSGRSFLGGGGGTTSSSGMVFEPWSEMSSNAVDGKKMKSQGSINQKDLEEVISCHIVSRNKLSQSQKQSNFFRGKFHRFLK